MKTTPSALFIDCFAIFRLTYSIYSAVQCTISSKRTGLNIFALFLLKNENTPVDNIQQEEDDRKEYPAVGVQPEIKFF